MTAVQHSASADGGLRFGTQLPVSPSGGRLHCPDDAHADPREAGSGAALLLS
jgi:hypothetical protein